MTYQLDDSPPPATGRLNKPEPEAMANMPSEIIRLLDFLQTAEHDLRFLSELREQHASDLERQPIVLRRVDTVSKAAAKALEEVRRVVETGLDKLRQSRSPFRKRAARKLIESAEFQGQEAVVTRHHAAILRELVHLRQLALRDDESSRASVTSADSGGQGQGPRSRTMSVSTSSTLARTESRPQFDNVGLLADLMGDAAVSQTKQALPPQYTAVSRSTYPLVKMHDTTGHRTYSTSSYPSDTLGYGKGTILDPAELSAEPITDFGPAELPGDVPSATNNGSTQVSPSLDSTPSSQPEVKKVLRKAISFDPTDDGDLVPFSPLDDLTPFIQPPPVVEEKQVVGDSSVSRPPTAAIYEEKELVVRQSMKKKSMQRILLNEEDRAGLALLMGDTTPRLTHHSSMVTLASVSSGAGTSTTWASPPPREQPEMIPPAPTQAPPPPPPSKPPKIPHGFIRRKPLASQSSYTTLGSNRSQDSASGSQAPAVQPLTTIPPQLPFVQTDIASSQPPTVPVIVVHQASPLESRVK